MHLLLVYILSFSLIFTARSLYDIDKYEQIWIHGSSRAQSLGSYSDYNKISVPRARVGASIWSESDMLVVFGGAYIPAGHIAAIPMNDMHKSTGGKVFYWIGGSTVVTPTYNIHTDHHLFGDTYLYPSPRVYSASWVINSKLYLFGGMTLSHMGSGATNDLYETSFSLLRSPSIDPTKVWKWTLGCATANHMGMYISYDTEALPAARYNAFNWVANNTGYIFGGMNALLSHYGDVMSFNGTSFTWLSGTNSYNDAGYYDCYNCTGRPSARTGGISWAINEKAYIFGGVTDEIMNDLWSISLDGKTWIWIGGCSIGGINAVGRYDGINNYPMARSSSHAVVIEDTAIIFSGEFGNVQFTVMNSSQFLGDWWSFTPDEHFVLMRGNNDTTNATLLRGVYNEIGSPGTIGARVGGNMVLWNGKIHLLFGMGFDNLAEIGFSSPF